MSTRTERATAAYHAASKTRRLAEQAEAATKHALAQANRADWAEQAAASDDVTDDEPNFVAARARHDLDTAAHDAHEAAYATYTAATDAAEATTRTITGD